MNKTQILKYLKEKDYIRNWWKLKDFVIFEDEDIIKFDYIDNELVPITKIKYDKKHNTIYVYAWNNYYNTNEIWETIQL